jgi:hypothetical protein
LGVNEVDVSLDRDEWRSNKSMIIDDSGTIKMPAITIYEAQTLQWKRQAKRFYLFNLVAFLIGIGIGMLLFK